MMQRAFVVDVEVLGWCANHLSNMKQLFLSYPGAWDKGTRELGSPVRVKEFCNAEVCINYLLESTLTFPIMQVQP